MSKVGGCINSLVDNDQLREVRIKIQRCYKESKGHQYPPDIEVMEQNSTLQDDMYRRRPPEVEPIPILLHSVSIVYGPLEGD